MSDDKKDSSRSVRWLIAFSKSYKFVKLFKVVQVMKMAKPLVVISSMALSTVTYAIGLGLGWGLGAGLVGMLFIHEMGHVAALKQKGFKVRPPIFIPMVGAVIFAPHFKFRSDEAFVGIAGPVAGGVAALVLFLFARQMSHPSVAVAFLCYIATYLNLLNMLPVRPLDGGRVMQIVSSRVKYLFILLLAGLTYKTRDPDLLLLWVLILQDLKIRPWHKVIIGFAIEAAMIWLYLAGLGLLPWWAQLIYVVMATIMNVAYLGVALSGDAFSEEDDRAFPPRKQKALWLLAYFALTLSLGVLIWFNISFMRPLVH